MTVSAVFQLFNRDGAAHTFTVAGASVDEYQQQVNNLLVLGYSYTQPAAVAAAAAAAVADGEWEEEISGYVVTKVDDQFRVWLYPMSGPLERPAVTVYWEYKNLLPFTVTKEDATTNLPPDKSDARARGIFHEYPMRVVLAKEYKPNGEPVLIKGYPKKKLVRVVSHEQPLWDKDPQQQQFEQQQQKPAAAAAAGNGSGKPAAVAGYPAAWRGPVDAQIWAMKNGYVKNEAEARDTFKKIMEEFGGSFGAGNKAQIFLRFYEQFAQGVAA